MLSKYLRFPLRSSIQNLRTMKRVEGRYFTAYLERTSQSQSKGAVIIGKNVSLLSTQRNKIKRMSLSVLREKLIKNPHQNVVLKAKRGLVAVPYEKIQQDITDISSNI